VLHGIDANLLDATSDICFVAAGVLVKSTLPDGLLSSSFVGHCQHLAFSAKLNPSPRETSLDQSSACGRVIVIPREFPGGVQVIREQDDRLDLKWTLLSHDLDRFPQGSADQFCGENLPPLMCHQREEEDASLAIPSIASHADAPSSQQNQSYRIIKKDQVSEKSSHQSWVLTQPTSLIRVPPTPHPGRYTILRLVISPKESEYR